MAKYKICPVCGEHNEPYMLECSKCETDLSSTRILDEDTEKAQSEQNSKENVSSSTAKMIRLCDCGFKNPVQSRKCQSCGEDISMVVPSPDEAETEETNKFIISSLDGSFAYEFVSESTVVGRENELQDYLGDKSYVSRRHAEFKIIDGKLYVFNFSKTNYTYINNVKIEDDNPKELKDGDEIGLGGNSQNGQRQNEAAYFVIRIGSCT